MSYDVSLVDPETREVLTVPSHEEGGTYQVGGTEKAELNITYNYSEVYRLVRDENNEGFSMNYLEGKTAESTIKKLQTVVDILGTNNQCFDYWAPTPGNAGYAASILLAWARLHPKGVWNVN
jgi:hypothetical protein